MRRHRRKVREKKGEGEGEKVEGKWSWEKGRKENWGGGRAKGERREVTEG